MGAPQGVRIVRGDGTEVPCELIHLGVDEHGMDTWDVANVEFHPEAGDTIRVDVLPPRTSVGFHAPRKTPSSP